MAGMQPTMIAGSVISRGRGKDLGMLYLQTMHSITAHRPSQGGLGVLLPVLAQIKKTRMILVTMATAVTLNNPARIHLSLFAIFKVDTILRGRAIIAKSVITSAEKE